MRVVAILLAVAGWAAARLLRRPLLHSAPACLTVANYRGREIPAIGGIVLITSLLACAGVFAGMGAFAAYLPTLPSPFALGSSVHLGIMLVAAGFFFLGLLDDISGETSAKGLRGHLGALRHGRVTTGVIKAAGGIALGFFVSAMWDPRLVAAVPGALIISASANLLNLLDLRPGRASKFLLVAWVPLALVAITRVPAFLPLSAGLAGAAAGWLPYDLGEKGILGDSGSNMLGGVAGAGIVLTAGPEAELITVAVLLGLTIASERFSFSRAIDRFAPLRWFDRLGRAPE